MVKTDIHVEKATLSVAATACIGLAARLAEADDKAALSFKGRQGLIDSLETYACVFTYYYTEVYGYGPVTDVIDPQGRLFAKYVLSASLVFSEPEALAAFLSKLPASWQRVKDAIVKAEKADAQDPLTKDIDDINEALASICKMK